MEDSATAKIKRTKLLIEVDKKTGKMFWQHKTEKKRNCNANYKLSRFMPAFLVKITLKTSVK